MSKLVTLLCAFALFASATAYASNAVRISQVYGGGGGGVSTPATWAQDYVELYNESQLPIDISGWTIEYGSATGNWGSSAGNIFTFPAGTFISPCRYVLVALGSNSANPAVPAVPGPDFSNTTTNMSATSGKVALFSAVNSNLACGSELPGTLLDKVSYGTGNCPEVTNIGTLSTTSGAVRGGDGVVDTDNNLADFTIVTNPTPHNSASPENPVCSPGPCGLTNVGPICRTPGTTVIVSGSNFVPGGTWELTPLFSPDPPFGGSITYISPSSFGFVIPVGTQLGNYTLRYYSAYQFPGCILPFNFSVNAEGCPTDARSTSWGQLKIRYR